MGEIRAVGMTFPGNGVLPLRGSLMVAVTPGKLRAQETDRTIQSGSNLRMKPIKEVIAWHTQAKFRERSTKRSHVVRHWPIQGDGVRPIEAGQYLQHHCGILHRASHRAD